MPIHRVTRLNPKAGISERTRSRSSPSPIRVWVTFIPRAVSSANGLQNGRQSLFGGQPGHREHAVRRAGRTRRLPGAEKGRIDSVVDAVDAVAKRGTAFDEIVSVVGGAGDDEAGQGDFFAQLRRVGGVDILGVGGEAERAAR